MARKARILDPALPPWRFLVFTDLHVQEKTLDRALEVLRRVGALAKKHDARILCLGDFWDLRGSLNVRQADAVMSELDSWQRDGLEAIFIPGNHDQVTDNGRVHGVRIFQAYPNITVVTEPIHWPERKIAFVPWRENPAEQAKIMEEAMLSGYTVFAHAEAPGATANSGMTMKGRFDFEWRGLAALTGEVVHARVYLGHFHKRQQIGDRCWYIGSPFEMNMGERADPHGVALITEDQIEPQWIDWDDFPKHHRLVYGETWDPKYIKAHDIVEVLASPSEIGTGSFGKALAELPAGKVKPMPIKNGKGDGVPQFALTLTEGIERWVDDGAFDTDRAVRLKMLARELLRNAGEAGAITPLSPRVTIASVSVHNFCALSGQLAFEIPKGETLIRGPMGEGKTSIMDAMTWCFFGVTSPRKAGSHGASLRADEVINDDAAECAVSVFVKLEDDTQIEIIRVKERGKGAKIIIHGYGEDGIADQQEQIHRILGIDYALWRTCVYLGQGAVGTFVTDADKKRKSLFDTAFGLNACPVAQKHARDRWKQLSTQVGALEIDIAGTQQVIAAFQEADFGAEIATWDAQRDQRLQGARAAGEQASKAVAECSAHLEGEATWLQSKGQHEQHIDTLTKSLARTTPAVKAANLQREYGGLQAERALIERDSAVARQELEKCTSDMQTQGQTACPTCGRLFEKVTAQQHLEDLESKVQGKGRELQSFDVRLNNVATKLDALNSQGSAERAGIEQQIGESRQALAKVSEALNAFVRLKANRADSERRLHEARASYAGIEQEGNPYLAKQAESEERVKTLEAKIRADQAELAGHEIKRDDYGFWDEGFGPKGIPVLVLRAALHELETYANRFMAQMLGGKIYCQLSMESDDLKILFFQFDAASGEARERRYEQLSGGQRRCVELAFNPFALSEMIFGRVGVRVSLLVVDELTTHLGAAEKPIICEILRQLDRESIIVIDHDITVQGEFDQVLSLTNQDGAPQLQRL